MELILPLLVLAPLLTFILTMFMPPKGEKKIYLITLFGIGAQLVVVAVFSIFWTYNGSIPINIKELEIYQNGNYNFFIDLYFDEFTAGYLFMSTFLVFTIAKFSRIYLHKELGFKRFFTSLILFYFGVSLIVLSGNFETLFIGWEILGISSFILIAYYKDRYLPVRNGFKVYSIYRIADIGILVAMWMSHHLWHENITFQQLNNSVLVHEHINENHVYAVVIALAIVVASSVKSAQFPFSSWLARAMEGPTPSSAVFYGSVAVHIGCYLLLRTYPFWSQVLMAKVLIIILGVISCIISITTSKVQPSIKSQIAYASTAQIGLIFIEIAFGFKALALIHLMGNAFLRSYQLLISPSVVAYKIREQFYSSIVGKEKTKYISPITKMFKHTLFVLSLKEWTIDNLMYKVLWSPIKTIGNKLVRINRIFLFTHIILLFLALFVVLLEVRLPSLVLHGISLLFGIISLIIIICSFTSRGSALLAWSLIFISHLGIAMAVCLNEQFETIQLIFYMSGVLISWVGGVIILRILSNKFNLTLNSYNGISQEKPIYSFMFLVCTLALGGFPISTTFLGEDLLISHIHPDQITLIILIITCYLIMGIALLRIYCRVFLGPAEKWPTPFARRMS